jgi:release factor glutamine methyltransferase
MMAIAASSNRSVHPLIHAATHRLQAAGLEHARYEAEWLLGGLLGVKPLELYLREEPIPSRIIERFRSQVDARITGMPLQYLLGETQFIGMRVAVVPGVFIPRPETEAIVEAALSALRERQQQLARSLRVLDLGTGSGCIAVTLAHALPTCVVVGVEVTWEALQIARQNVLRHGLASRVWLVQGSWGEAMSGGFDGIISNPPYVPCDQVERLPSDVRHEPRVSLDGGEDGMRELRQLITQAPRLLAQGGVMILECGEGHVGTLIRVASASSWVKRVSALDDLAARPRGVLIRRK